MEISLSFTDGPSLSINADLLHIFSTLGHWGTSGSALSTVMTEQHGSDVIHVLALTHTILNGP